MKMQELHYLLQKFLPDKETRVHTKLYVINYLSSTTQVHDFKMYTDIQTEDLINLSYLGI